MKIFFRAARTWSKTLSMSLFRRITGGYFFALIFLCTANWAPCQFANEPASLAELSQTLRKIADSALSEPPPTAEQSQAFLNEFLKDPYLNHFPRPRGQVLSIVNEIWYLWSDRRAFLNGMETLHTNRSPSKRISTDLDLQRPAIDTPAEPTKEEAALLLSYKEREKRLVASISLSFAELDTLEKLPANQKFLLPAASPASKALKKLTATRQKNEIIK